MAKPSHGGMLLPETYYKVPFGTPSDYKGSLEDFDKFSKLYARNLQSSVGTRQYFQQGLKTVTHTEDPAGGVPFTNASTNFYVTADDVQSIQDSISSMSALMQTADTGLKIRGMNDSDSVNKIKPEAIRFRSHRMSGMDSYSKSLLANELKGVDGAKIVPTRDKSVVKVVLPAFNMSDDDGNVITDKQGNPQWFDDYTNLTKTSRSARSKAKKDIKTKVHEKEAEKSQKAQEKQDEKNQNEREKQEQEKKKAEEKEEAQFRRNSIKTLSVVIMLLTGIFNAIKNIVVATVDRAVEEVQTGRKARDLGIPLKHLEELRYFAQSKGLDKEVFTNAFTYLQDAYGDPHNAPKLPSSFVNVVQGTGVESLVKSGLNGDNSETATQKILDAYLGFYRNGKTSLGLKADSKEDSRRSLITSLKDFSPELAMILSSMIDEYEKDNKVTNYKEYQDTFGAKDRTGNTSIDWGYLERFGELANSFKSVFNMWKDDNIVKIANLLSDILSWLQDHFHTKDSTYTQREMALNSVLEGEQITKQRNEGARQILDSSVKGAINPVTGKVFKDFTEVVDTYGGMDSDEVEQFILNLHDPSARIALATLQQTAKDSATLKKLKANKNNKTVWRSDDNVFAYQVQDIMDNSLGAHYIPYTIDKKGRRVLDMKNWNDATYNVVQAQASMTTNELTGQYTRVYRGAGGAVEEDKYGFMPVGKVPEWYDDNKGTRMANLQKMNPTLYNKYIKNMPLTNDERAQMNLALGEMKYSMTSTDRFNAGGYAWSWKNKSPMSAYAYWAGSQKAEELEAITTAQKNKSPANAKLLKDVNTRAEFFAGAEFKEQQSNDIMNLTKLLNKAVEVKLSADPAQVEVFIKSAETKEELGKAGLTVDWLTNYMKGNNSQ